jgi:HEAT repeat protein
VRKSAVHAAALFSSEPPTARLLALLADSDKEVRMEALSAVRHNKDLSAKDLAPALSDPAPDVRQFARSILERIKQE